MSAMVIHHNPLLIKEESFVPYNENYCDFLDQLETGEFAAKSNRKASSSSESSCVSSTNADAKTNADRRSFDGTFENEHASSILSACSTQKSLETNLSFEQQAKIQGILDNVSQLSDKEKLLLYLKLPTRNESQESFSLATAKQEQTQAFQWIRAYVEEGDSCINLPKHEVYDKYRIYCTERGASRTLSAPDFGKIIKCVFPRVKARRLGTRGNSKYCYSGLQMKNMSPRTDCVEEEVDSNRLDGYGCDVSEDQTVSAASSLVCEWANKLLGRVFNTLIELAKFLVSGSYVSTKSMAAFMVMSATEETVQNISRKLICQSTLSAPSGVEKHNHVNFQTQSQNRPLVNSNKLQEAYQSCPYIQSPTPRITFPASSNAVNAPPLVCSPLYSPGQSGMQIVPQSLDVFRCMKTSEPGEQNIPSEMPSSMHGQIFLNAPAYLSEDDLANYDNNANCLDAISVIDNFDSILKQVAQRDCPDTGSSRGHSHEASVIQASTIVPSFTETPSKRKKQNDLTSLSIYGADLSPVPGKDKALGSTPLKAFPSSPAKASGRKKGLRSKAPATAECGPPVSTSEASPFSRRVPDYRRHGSDSPLPMPSPHATIMTSQHLPMLNFQSPNVPRGLSWYPPISNDSPTTGLLSPDCSSELRSIFASSADFNSPLNGQFPPHLQRCQSVPPPRNVGVVRMDQLHSLTPQVRPSHRISIPCDQLDMPPRAKRNLTSFFEGGAGDTFSYAPTLQTNGSNQSHLKDRVDFPVACGIGGRFASAIPNIKQMVASNLSCSVASVSPAQDAVSLSRVVASEQSSNVPETLDDVDDLLKALNTTENVWTDEFSSATGFTVMSA